MHDLELLELAAKAVGWTVDEIVEYNGKLVVHLNEPEATVAWQPLTDDGDALSLAVKRKIFRCHMDLFHQFYEEEIATGVNEQDATRRAIVRAVAEIGKELK